MSNKTKNINVKKRPLYINGNTDVTNNRQNYENIKNRKSISEMLKMILTEDK